MGKVGLLKKGWELWPPCHHVIFQTQQIITMPSRFLKTFKMNHHCMFCQHPFREKDTCDWHEWQHCRLTAQALKRERSNMQELEEAAGKQQQVDNQPGPAKTTQGPPSTGSDCMMVEAPWPMPRRGECLIVEQPGTTVQVKAPSQAPSTAIPCGTPSPLVLSDKEQQTSKVTAAAPTLGDTLATPASPSLAVDQDLPQQAANALPPYDNISLHDAVTAQSQATTLSPTARAVVGLQHWLSPLLSWCW